MHNRSEHSLADEAQRARATVESHVTSAVEYIEANYEGTDRLAIVVRNRVTGETIQRLATAKKIVTPEFQAWLRHKNARGTDIYISQNVLGAEARTRTKGDIDAIRHVYLDLDRNGDEALERVQRSEQVPQPNYVIKTSRRKYQIIWKVDGLTANQAESLQRALVAEFDGDPAATDSTRVLRLPGFNNKKYEQDDHVTAQSYSSQTYSLADFRLPTDERHQQDRVFAETPMRGAQTGEVSQSERDWAFARRHLAGGEPPETLIQAIAHFRQDKADPEYYSRQTVTRAYASVALSRGDDPAEVERRVAEIATHQGNPETYATDTVSEMQGREWNEKWSQSNPMRSSGFYSLKC